MQEAAVPTDYPSIVPYLIVADAPGLMKFLTQAFGAVTRFVAPGEAGKVMHAEMKLGSGVLMTPTRPDRRRRRRICATTSPTRMRRSTPPSPPALPWSARRRASPTASGSPASATRPAILVDLRRHGLTRRAAARKTDRHWFARRFL